MNYILDNYFTFDNYVDIGIFFFVLKFFFIFSSFCLFCFRDIIYKTFCLIIVFFVGSCMVICVGMSFIGFIILVLYVGAVLVLFLFVIMSFNKIIVTKNSNNVNNDVLFQNLEFFENYYDFYFKIFTKFYKFNVNYFYIFFLYNFWFFYFYLIDIDYFDTSVIILLDDIYIYYDDQDFIDFIFYDYSYAAYFSYILHYNYCFTFLAITLVLLCSLIISVYILFFSKNIFYLY